MTQCTVQSLLSWPGLGKDEAFLCCCLLLSTPTRVKGIFIPHCRAHRPKIARGSNNFQRAPFCCYLRADSWVHHGPQCFKVGLDCDMSKNSAGGN
ncbi:hypothetical protein BDW71DRAFT_72538 [Aspergillus fruticulosus]